MTWQVQTKREILRITEAGDVRITESGDVRIILDDSGQPWPAAGQNAAGWSVQGPATPSWAEQ